MDEKLEHMIDIGLKMLLITFIYGFMLFLIVCFILAIGEVFYSL